MTDSELAAAAVREPRLVAEIRRLREALQEVADVLGPAPTNHCEGCQVEMTIALDAAQEALTG